MHHHKYRPMPSKPCTEIVLCDQKKIVVDIKNSVLDVCSINQEQYTIYWSANNENIIHNNL